ncbi:MULTISPECIES: aldo/keto reductase family oxidoreductase [unclassified Colwellia]|uniref:aldo/keto reductase n=1 Tax=unclassified Colwellia TaxID=196834 RepID=UPI0015F47DC2|nr:MULTISPECIES: aldo/keto reductase [unclassified Colwellia]MBA6338888.1 aldo/keto reductase [Colwellia sp. BRX8-7]MBA6353223.1 aldo/keto reductase [Colwellia sp. BRX9-1]MBA6355862.1 aldo/keto reductase [Colwellia sp. BRX8-3]MBA6359535.1 aldo/keto reductase [Colwellia sp. BRX8-6]MBA6367416.1 aldo/keto reductase [Colwellia sp. BRX8-5]
MKNYSLGKSELQSSRLIYGCMRIAGDQSVNDIDKGKRAVQSAIDAGYNHFDHADIYGGGASEQLFGELLKQLPHLREKMILTSKASIRPKNNENTYAPTRYDFSKAYILSSVEGSLKRLHTEQLDLFLLHRPDYLFDINEVAETFKQLKDSGKVAHFGVSNFKPSQVAMLQSALDLPLLVNQIEINIHNVDALNDGTLDQCQQDKLSPIAWCPLGGVAYSAWGNTFSVEDEQRIAEELTSQAQVYNCQPWQIILAWLLKHPAKIFPIIGSTTPERIIAAKVALELNYSREDWYRLFEARNGQAVP